MWWLGGVIGVVVVLVWMGYLVYSDKAYFDDLQERAKKRFGLLVGEDGSGFPKNMEWFFETGKCPNCGHDKWSERQDGGHDALIECQNCEARYGVQFSPFNLIELVKEPKKT